jgi:hypothetical protein
MRDREIDDILKQAADTKPVVDPALLDRISRSIGSDLRPVRELPSPWILGVGLIVVCGVAAFAGAMFFGLEGVKKMGALEVGLIFPALAILIWTAATLSVAEAIPGSRRFLAPWLMGVSGCIGLAAVFGVVFHDYRTTRFVHEGVKCLAAGVGLAVPAAVATWLVLRRGYAVNPEAAGFVRGILAGLAGVTMLELHCANFEALHVMVWHVAVLPVCGVAGMWVARRMRSLR